MKRDVEVPRFLPICRVSTPIRAGSEGIARLYVSERGRALPNIRGGTGHESGRAREPRLVAAFGSIRGAPGGGGCIPSIRLEVKRGYSPTSTQTSSGTLTKVGGIPPELPKRATFRLKVCCLRGAGITRPRF